LAGAVEIPADEGNLPKRLFGEDAELEGKLGEENRGVVVTKMVRSVDGGLVFVEFFRADEGDGREADEEQNFGPGVGDSVLLAAGLVPQAGDERDAAEAGGGEGDQRHEQEVGQPTEGAGALAGWVLLRGLW